MNDMSFHLRLSVEAPLLTHAAGTLSLGVDAATQRHRGQPVLNGSQVRGHLRHLLQRYVKLLQAAGRADELGDSDLELWFGKPKGSDDEEYRGALSFDFYWYPEDTPTHGPAQPARHRVELGETGAAAQGQLAVIENAYPTGAQIVFHGRIRMRLGADALARFPVLDPAAAVSHCRHWLAKAVQMLPAVGALKAVGYGRVVAAELVECQAVVRAVMPTSDTLIPADAMRLGLRLTLDRPFHFGATAAHRPNDNRHVHGVRIPGAALKAVLANVWKARGGDPQTDLRIDQLVMTDAVPAPMRRPDRQAPLPLSLAVVADGQGRPQVRDLAAQADPCLLDLGAGWRAPAFLPDWKRDDLRAAQRAWLGIEPEPVPALLRVRTAIEPERRIADEARLFAIEYADVNSHVWCADIDLSQVPEHDRPDVRDRLAEALRDGLPGLGKSAAEADARLLGASYKSAPPKASSVGALTVLLATPARLLPDDLNVSGINGDAGLARFYADYWEQASDGKLELGHYFARQEMVGGRFYQLSYGAASGAADDYRPAWLTLTGSVFVLHPAAGCGQHQALVDDWHACGLPPVTGADGSAFRTEPYLRENGYGEVYIDHPRHAALAPTPQEVRSINGGTA